MVTIHIYIISMMSIFLDTFDIELILLHISRKEMCLSMNVELINLSYGSALINLSYGSADDRNNLEKLTLAVLSHLPTAVLFVHDLSGECGTSPSDQVSLGQSLFSNLIQYLKWGKISVRIYGCLFSSMTCGV